VKYILAILLLSGCASFDVPPAPQIGRSVFSLYVQEGDLPKGVNGTATFYETLNVCVVVLREYPMCLLHEIRHCIEGAWHDARPNSEDCQP
jgi:hypothetical protein